MDQQTGKKASPRTVTFVLCLVVQWTWGIVQNLIGLAYFLAALRNRHFRFRTSIVTQWKIPFSVGCGMFVFVSNENEAPDGAVIQSKWDYDNLVHEYGHCIQSMLLGPLFVPVIAIPSVIWSSLPFFERFREKRKRSYYWLYCEKWANMLGDKICRNNRLHS